MERQGKCSKIDSLRAIFFKLWVVFAGVSGPRDRRLAGSHNPHPFCYHFIGKSSFLVGALHPSQSALILGGCTHFTALPRLVTSGYRSTAITKPSPNAGLMLGKRLRRWPNIKPTLVEHPVSAGFISSRYYTRLVEVGQE